MMKSYLKYLFIISIGLIFGYFVANVVTIEKPLSSNLELIEDSFDLGTINEHDTITVSTILKNIGSSKVDIKSVTTSCGCTNGVVDKYSIMPNDSTYLKATFSPLSKGYFNSMVNVESTALNSKITVYIYGYAE